jgi:integrase
LRELDVWHQTTRWTADDALVFAEPAVGGVLRRGALMRRYRRALKAAKLEEAHRFHGLRHTFGTAMAAAGVPMRTLQEWMGHRGLQTTLMDGDYVPNPGEVAMVDQSVRDYQLDSGPISVPTRTLLDLNVFPSDVVTRARVLCRGSPVPGLKGG